MNFSQTKVLVLGDDTQSFLATVRSLGRRGVAVHVAPQNFKSSALKSRYIQKIHRLPLYGGDGSRWLTAIEQLLIRERFDLAIPCTDAALLPMHAARASLEPLCRLALPSEEAIDVLFDKVRTRELADRLGIPIARGMMFAPGGDRHGAIKTIGLPLVLKPRRSFRIENLQWRETVQILQTEDEASQSLADVTDHAVLLETYFPGVSVGVSVLAREGRVLRHFQHVRVHPAKSGSSGYRRSSELDWRLARACNLMVSALQYTGVLMFEFRQDPHSGQWILLEGNARPWGSLPLPVSLGIDFPAWWMDLLLTKAEPPSKSYATNRYARNLTRDVYYLFEQLAPHRHEPWQAARLLMRWGMGMTRVLIGVEKSDTLVLDDLRPGLHELTDLTARLWHRMFGRRPRDARGLIEGELARAMRSHKSSIHVEFVCTGNICRSPYAEKLMLHLLPAPLPLSVTTGSSGSLSMEGRSSPTDAVDFAIHHSGVDLTIHRSRHLTEELVAAATILVVFEEINEENVLRLYPHARPKLVWLGDFLPGERRGTRIEDPHGKGRAVYERSFSMIEEGVRQMVQLLEGQQTALTETALAH